MPRTAGDDSHHLVLLSGSKLAIKETSCARVARRYREILLERGLLERKDDHLLLNRNVFFGAPSPLTGAVSGQNSNGLKKLRTLWPHGITSRTLEEGDLADKQEGDANDRFRLIYYRKIPGVIHLDHLERD